MYSGKIKGKTRSRTDPTPVNKTRVRNQGESGLCWDYAASTSIRQSIRIKLGMILFTGLFGKSER